MRLSRSGCLGPCPTYYAVLNVDGTATYHGVENVDRRGDYSGAVSLVDFGQLCLLVDRSGFMSLASQFSAPWTDAQTVTVSVFDRDGRVKVVTDYGGFAPPEAWVVEHAIDAVVAKIRWTTAAPRVN